MQNYFNLDDIVYLTEEQDFEIKRSRLKEKDVLLTITGVSYGKSAVVPKEIEGANINQHSVKMELEGLSPYFLSTFLNSKIGKLQSDKYIVGVTRPALDYTSIKKFLIPNISEVFQQHIEDIILKAHMKRLDSQNLYSSAESYLLECLGMTDFVANTENYNIKTLKESFLETGRIDSEYYLPKYEDYQRIVENYSEGFAACAKVCTIKEANYIPLDDKLYRYIELSNIGKSGEITGYDFQKGKDLPTRARRIVEQGDVIVSSIEGSLSSCALITKEYDQSLCSTGFYVLRSSVLNPETLLTLFKSFPLQQLMKKGCSGTILTAISKLELEQIPIPLIRPEVQAQIAQYIQESYALRKEAQQLLEEAKLSVERNIQMGGGKILIINKLQKESVLKEHLALQVLLSELGFFNKKAPISQVSYTEKSISESFLSNGRLDAEYYQPKYDYLFNFLEQVPTMRLGELVQIQKSIEPGSDAYQEEGIPFVRVADLSKFGIEKPSVYLDKTIYNQTIRPQKDTILLSKDGSVGIAYKVDRPLDVITSGAILHLSLTSQNVLSDYLTLVLNSSVVKMQAERDAGGSVIQHWKPSEIKQVVIPILPIEVQQKLSDKVKQSFALREEAIDLLEKAKMQVEEAISSFIYPDLLSY
jgi:hypothetical protein